MLSVRPDILSIRKGLIAQLTDTVTSLAISTLGIPPPTGASVNISCEFVRPAGKQGDDLYSVGEVVKLGQSSSHLAEVKLMCQVAQRHSQKLHSTINPTK